MRRLVVIVLALAVAAAACATGDPGAGSSSGRDRTSPGSLLPRSPSALPTFDMARYERLLAELRGAPVVVNVWASWCGPCRLEAPGLARVAREFEGRVQFVGVDVLDHRPKARAFIHEFGWTYPSVFDPAGQIMAGLGFLGPPVTLLFDPAGRQAMVVSGPISEEKLREEITRVLRRA